jgi:hypothetical protein
MPTTTPTATPAATTGAPSPITATDWAYAILLGLGIDPTNKGNSITALIAQMHAEDNTLTYLTSKNNPLAVTNAGGTPIPGNSAGVQEYSTWQQGLTATVTDIKANPAMLSALQNNSSCQQYGGAVAKSTWEGSGGNNASYGASVAGSCNAPDVQSNMASSAFGTWLANNPNIGPDIVSQLGGAAESAATSTTSDLAALGTLASDLTNGAWWKRVGLFALGAGIFVIGLAGFISTTKEGQKVVSQGESAAAVAAVA